MNCLLDREAYEITINEFKGYKIGLVYSEYGDKIDLVCLDKTKIDNSMIQKPDRDNHDLYPIYKLPVLVGIELKFIQRGYYNHGIETSFRDFDKLLKLNYVKNKLALCFLRDGEVKKSKKEAELFFDNILTTYKVTPVDDIVIANGVYLITKEKTYGVKNY